ncbi:hypothetical protein V2W45_1469436 [Cenococcum geophilum]
MERLCLEELIKRYRSVAERYKEGLLLKEVIEASVENIAWYYHYKTVHIKGAIDDVRNNVWYKLLLNAKILYRNILVGNVMLNKLEDNGFLINLNLTIKIDRKKASGVPSKTSTKVFIVIGALYGEDYSFIYNLESPKIKIGKLRKVVFLEGKRRLRED